MNTLNISFYLKISLAWSFEVDHSESIRDSAMPENRGGARGSTTICVKVDLLSHLVPWRLPND
jgi:hypothetical protein